MQDYSFPCNCYIACIGGNIFLLDAGKFSLPFVDVVALSSAVGDMNIRNFDLAAQVSRHKMPLTSFNSQIFSCKTLRNFVVFILPLILNVVEQLPRKKVCPERRYVRV